MIKDKIFTKTISSSILKSYTIDSVRILYSSIEKNFRQHQDQCDKTIQFISRWLLLIDDHENSSLHSVVNSDIWFLAHVYTLLEYEQTDLFSLYSACRIMDTLDSTQSFYDSMFEQQSITRSKIQENLFELMFNHLWSNLRHVTQTNEHIQEWIQTYAFISKYYPSERVLQQMKLVDMQYQIQFMNLAYLILVNDQTLQPSELVQRLLLNNEEEHHRTCLQSISIFIEIIYQYFQEKTADNCTLMIDIQQWIINTLKSTNRTSFQKEMINLLKFLNQPTCYLSFPIEEFLFDELMNINIEHLRRSGQSITDSWDRLCLFPFIFQCLSDENLDNYQLPFHPSVIQNENQQQILLDLFFFYLRRLSTEDIIRSELINKILVTKKAPKIDNRTLIPIAENIFKQIKDYFLIQTTALLFCQTDFNEQNQQRLDQMLTTIIEQYFFIDEQTTKFNQHLELFLTIIINKHSWNFLLNLFVSECFQRVNSQWSNQINDLLQPKTNLKRNHHLQLCHQLQFTITTDNTTSIFPTLNQPFLDLTKIIEQCIQIDNIEQRWISLSNWIQSQLNFNSHVEIKVMLLLNIYYSYYCNNQLESLEHLLTIIENKLQPSQEELRVFRVILKPKEFMIGYRQIDPVDDENLVNDLFKLDCHDDYELCIRHSLVNLLAMTLLGEQNSFLWTFIFDPMKLRNTLGEFHFTFSTYLIMKKSS